METFAIRAGFVVPAPRVTMEFRGRAARVTIAVALVLLTSYGAPRLLTHAQTMTAAPTVTNAAATAAPAETKAPFDVDSVVERASHAITRVPGETGALEVRAPGYHARFDHTGFTYAPTKGTQPFALSLTDVARGEHSLVGNLGAWSSTANIAQRTVSAGVTEQVTSRAGEIEWDVVLASPPTGTGPLTIGADLRGVVGTPTPVDGNTAWQLSLAGGASVTLGQTIVKDATGSELYRALPDLTAGRIVLVVPAAVLTTAAYPLTIDPKISSPVTLASTDLVNNPAVASDGSNYLVVWSADLSGYWRIYGARVSADGTFVQSLGAISPAASGRSSVLPDVAWNGSSYLVVYQYNFTSTDVDIRGRRVAANGALLGVVIGISEPSGYQTRAAVTAAGSTFYVVWQDDRAGNDDIYGGRVDSNGTRLDGEGVVVQDGGNDEILPDVAWNGSNFLVVFEYAFSATDHDLHARPVNSSGVAIGFRQTITNTGALEEDPTISNKGTEFFVAWEDSRNAATGTDIYGARLAALGTTITGNIAISRAAGEQTDPAIAFNGSYLVVWTDRRNSGQFDLYANRVTANGAVQDGSGFAVVTYYSNSTPAVARGPGNKWAVDYETYSPGNSSAIVHRTIAPK